MLAFKSSCPYAHKFKYGSSLVPNLKNPCTNIPILCTIPGCTGTVGNLRKAIWKYNMEEHIHTVHPGYPLDSTDLGVPIPDDLAHAMFITHDEETWMGIPPEKILQSDSNPSLGWAGASRKRGEATTCTRPTKRRR
ncbi:hypothetical protein C8Q72DRAFT_857147 [Fomitopsis betulina]|nr:hypothetical protein C8Q72DRAFT_857147 [Fomitopsis betulina]